MANNVGRGHRSVIDETMDEAIVALTSLDRTVNCS